MAKIRDVEAVPSAFVCPEGVEPLTSGSEEFCRALVSYFNKEMSIAAIAKFAVVPGARFYNGTHTVVMGSVAYNQYSVSVARLRDSAQDFRAGFEANHG